MATKKVPYQYYLKTAKTFKGQCSMVCVGYEDPTTGAIKPVSAYVAP